MATNTYKVNFSKEDIKNLESLLNNKDAIKQFKDIKRFESFKTMIECIKFMNNKGDVSVTKEQHDIIDLYQNVVSQYVKNGNTNFLDDKISNLLFINTVELVMAKVINNELQKAKGTSDYKTMKKLSSKIMADIFVNTLTLNEMSQQDGFTDIDFMNNKLVQAYEIVKGSKNNLDYDKDYRKKLKFSEAIENLDEKDFEAFSQLACDEGAFNDIYFNRNYQNVFGKNINIKKLDKMVKDGLQSLHYPCPTVIDYFDYNGQIENPWTFKGTPTSKKICHFENDEQYNNFVHSRIFVDNVAQVITRKTNEEYTLKDKEAKSINKVKKISQNIFPSNLIINSDTSTLKKAAKWVATVGAVAGISLFALSKCGEVNPDNKKTTDPIEETIDGTNDNNEIPGPGGINDETSKNDEIVIGPNGEYVVDFDENKEENIVESNNNGTENNDQINNNDKLKPSSNQNGNNNPATGEADDEIIAPPEINNEG